MRLIHPIITFCMSGTASFSSSVFFISWGTPLVNFSFLYIQADVKRVTIFHKSRANQTTVEFLMLAVEQCFSKTALIAQKFCISSLLTQVICFFASLDSSHKILFGLVGILSFLDQNASIRTYVICIDSCSCRESCRTCWSIPNCWQKEAISSDVVEVGRPIQLIISEIICLISLNKLEMKLVRREFYPTMNDLQVVKRWLIGTQGLVTCTLIQSRLSIQCKSTVTISYVMMSNQSNQECQYCNNAHQLATVTVRRLVYLLACHSMLPLA